MSRHSRNGLKSNQQHKTSIALTGWRQQSRLNDRRPFFLEFPYIYTIYSVMCRALRQASPHKQGFAGTDLLKEETILSKNSKGVMDRAEASFKKEERAREGAKAMRDYEAEGRAVRDKTARLKSLRLAKEAAEKEAELKKNTVNSR
jgi:hypothetical protein